MGAIQMAMDAIQIGNGGPFRLAMGAIQMAVGAIQVGNGCHSGYRVYVCVQCSCCVYDVGSVSLQQHARQILVWRWYVCLEGLSKQYNLQLVITFGTLSIVIGASFSACTVYICRVHSSVWEHIAGKQKFHTAIANSND